MREKKQHHIVRVFTFLLFTAIFQREAAVGQIPGGGLPASTPEPIPGAYTNPAINYIRVWEPSRPLTDPAAVAAQGNTIADVKQTTQYFDGLGRPLQTVAKGMGGTGYDMVTPVVYDVFGREQFRYLPYMHASTDGKFKPTAFSDQEQFYRNSGRYPDERIFYSRTEFEASPLNRVLKTYAPGNSWASRPVTHQFFVNTAADSVRIWNIGATGNPVSTGTYAAGQLTVDVTTDEDGVQVREYKDKSGQLVLRKLSGSTNSGSAHMGWLCTYYIYDDLNNLRFVIPPLGVEKITGSWNITTIADGLCFQYTYDSRNRMITKKLPGVGAVEMVYDMRDRLVFTRDSSQRALRQWHLTFYDPLNRPVETALYNRDISREVLQTQMNGAVNNSGTSSYVFPGTADLTVAYHDRNLYEAVNSVTLENGFDTQSSADVDVRINPAQNNGRVDVAVSNPLPDVFSNGTLLPLTFTFYDKYDYQGARPSLNSDFGKPSDSGNLYVEPVTVSTLTKGLVTGTRTRILGTETWLTTTTYYNDKGRVSQVLSDNAGGGTDVITTRYDFSGKIVGTYQRHTNSRSGVTPQTTVLTTMIYDAQGRLKAVNKKLNDNPGLARTITRNTYDQIGLPEIKELGIAGAGSPLERQTYDYNLRGWLRSISKEYLKNGSGGAHFGQELNYDYGFTNKAFNGNIAGIRWKGWNDTTQRAYGFTYDQTNRLKSATFSQINGGNWLNNTVDFTVKNITYDANGNLLSMLQRGQLNNAPGNIDQLSYRYNNNSNQLKSVYDTVRAKTGLDDFSDSQTDGVDYSYDGAGNLIRDENKQIASISYNHLHLPELITVTGKGSIQLLYDAVGNKVHKTVTDNTGGTPKVTTTDYLGGLVYENDSLRFASHEEGRIRTVYQAGQVPTFVYDYFVRDHLGNTRLVLTDQTNFTMYAATMETPNAARENLLFSNIDNTRSTKPVGYPADESAGNNESVARLSATGTGKKIGPSLVLRVMAGDTIQLSSKAFYKSNGLVDKNGPVVPAENMLAELVNAFGGGSSADATHGAPVSIANTPFDANFYNNDYRRLKEKESDQQPGKPKAYLNYVLFDDHFKMVEENSGVKQVKAEPDQLQTLSQDKMVVKKSGFLYVYTSNESTQEVFFDNLLVGQSNGPVLEETHYYPFGLTMAGISGNALKGANYSENRLKYNGNELQSKEFVDGSGLELYDFNARTYDQQIGRFLQIDPLVENNQEALTPYHFAFNNPIRYGDPDGKFPIVLPLLPVIGEALATLGAAVGITVVATKALDKLRNADLGSINYTPGSPFGPYTPTQTARLMEAKNGEATTESTPVSAKEQPSNAGSPKDKPENDEGTKRSTNKLEADKKAGADHTTFLRDKDGNVYKYEEWNENPRNPNRFDTKKRFDGGTKDGTPGNDHGGLPTPHMNQKKDSQGNKIPKGVRIPTGNEFPRNNRFLPWLKSK